MSGNIDLIIVRALLMLGVSPNTKGFHYLRRAILIYVTRPKNLADSTKHLYTSVAEYFGATASSVERAVRHSVQTGWYKRDRLLAERIFFNILQGENDVPSNTIFISAAGDWVRSQIGEG